MNKLREIRQSKKISQWSLAQKSKVHQSRISLTENDLIEPTEQEKKNVAEALGVPVNEIFGEVDSTAVSEKDNQRKKAVLRQK